ncbi:MAG: hypothetical protein GF411_14705 [Candidatus Lokiarchaeota archaeon]|nr:hypothetical protein [Candidatus Lokiarchaeota archaeon]
MNPETEIQASRENILRDLRDKKKHINKLEAKIKELEGDTSSYAVFEFIGEEVEQCSRWLSLESAKSFLDDISKRREDLAY